MPLARWSPGQTAWSWCDEAYRRSGLRRRDQSPGPHRRPGRGEIVNGSITAVISSSPEAYALERAKQAGIPGYVLARQDYPSNRAMTVALVDKLRELDIQLVVLAGFMTILTEEMVQAFPSAILNIHPALIPSFAGPGCYGLHVHEKALAYGVKLSGATVHFVSPGVRRGSPSSCKRRWRSCPTIRRRCCAGGSWSSASGSCCPRPSPSSARTG